MSIDSQNVARPIVTIAIPTLNRPETCALAIRSAIDQLGASCSLLISENCSDPQYQSRYDDLFESLPANAKVIRQTSRLPVDVHFQRLVSSVETRFVVMLADDDVLTPDFVRRSLALAESEGHAIVFGPYRAEWKRSGKHRDRNYDFSATHRVWRVTKFFLRRNDSFFYGLFDSVLLNRAMPEFKPLTILGRRTLTRIAYAPLLVCLLNGSYGHLDGQPVWISTVDAAKSEVYLGRSGALKLLLLVLGEVNLAGRFIRITAAEAGAPMAALLTPVIVLAALLQAAGFVLLAARRAVAAVSSRLRGGRNVERA